MNNQTDPIFGDVIHAYSRAEALEDGVLVDAGMMAQEAGLKWPVALTRGVWAAYVEVPPGVQGQNETGRLWDILWMAAFAARKTVRGGRELLFSLHVRNDNRDRTPPLRRLKMVSGPGDDGEPVLTILLPEED